MFKNGMEFSRQSAKRHMQMARLARFILDCRGRQPKGRIPFIMRNKYVKISYLSPWVKVM